MWGNRCNLPLPDQQVDQGVDRLDWVAAVHGGGANAGAHSANGRLGLPVQVGWTSPSLNATFLHPVVASVVVVCLPGRRAPAVSRVDWKLGRQGISCRRW